tara:strand:- start:1034 stop:3001 length:1968 start_codon:yes stop_codon:yes gene_type:complete
MYRQISLSKLFLFLVLFFFLYTHITYVISSNIDRKVPADIDDAYHAIVKASNITNCLEDYCIGLKDIYQQTNQYFINDHQKEFADRQEHRILFSYHPFYSYLIAKIHKFGATYEKSKLITDIFGSVLLCISVTLFLTSFFGAIPASISIISLISWSMMGHGLLEVNYFMFSLSFGLIALSFHIIKGNYFARSLIVLMALFFSLMSHTIGIIFVLISFFFIFFKEFLKKFKLNKNILIQFTVTIFLIFIFNIIDINFISEKIIITDLYQTNNSYSDMFSRNLLAIKTFFYFLNQNLNIFLALIFVIIGLFIIKDHYKNDIFIMIFVLTVLFISTLFAPNVPGDYGSTILYRISPIFYIFFYGLVGTLGSQVFVIVNRKFLKNFTLKKNDHKREFIIKIFLSIMVILLSINSLLNNLDLRNKKINSNKKLDNVIFDRNQVEKLLELSSPSDSVLYLTGTHVGDRIGEAINYFYLTYGSSKRGFVWNELIKNTNFLETWSNRNIRYLVAKNPLLENGLKTNINLRKDKIFINFSEIKFKKFYIKLKGSKNSKLKIDYGDKFYIMEGPFFGWTLIPKINEKYKSMKIIGLNENVYLNGIKFNKQSTNWPWNSELTITTVDENKKISFNHDSIIKNKNLKIINILDDNGASVLAEVELND